MVSLASISEAILISCASILWNCVCSNMIDELGNNLDITLNFPLLVINFTREKHQANGENCTQLSLSVIHNTYTCAHRPPTLVSLGVSLQDFVILGLNEILKLNLFYSLNCSSPVCFPISPVTHMPFWVDLTMSKFILKCSVAYSSA